MDSFTITFTGTEPELKAVFFPPIELNGTYVIGLVDFQSYNAIYNVKEPFNVIHYYKVYKMEVPKGEVSIDDLNVLLSKALEFKVVGKNVIAHLKVKIITHKGFGAKLNKLKLIENRKIRIEDNESVLYCYYPNDVQSIQIPEGSYEVGEMVKEIQKQLPDFKLTVDSSKMKAVLNSGLHVYDFTKENIGSQLLGFKGHSTYTVPYESKNIINVNNINVIRVKCNIADGSYLNGNKSLSIHSFYPTSPPGYKIIEVPRNIIYFPVNRRILDVVTITFADQDDRPISFNGEETTITCHIKKI